MFRFVLTLKPKQMNSKKSIYDLEMHEHLDVDFFSVLRVPGGWVYLFPKTSNLFVPFNNEFQKQNK